MSSPTDWIAIIGRVFHPHLQASASHASSGRADTGLSQFSFVAHDWPEVFDAAVRAENAARPDPRASCFYARRSLELAVVWIYKHDNATTLPYQENLSALIHDPTFKQTVGLALFAKARLIKDLGNLAAHS